MMENFYSWLMKHKKINSRIGGLARTVSIDRYRPRKDILEQWETHLYLMSASNAVIENFREAWALYKAGKKPDKVNEEYNIKLKKDEWSISPLILPNYWVGKTELIRVQCAETNKNYEFNFQVHSVCNRMFMNAIEQLGIYFQREFFYDFPPYDLEAHFSMGDFKNQPYLFLDVQDYNVFSRPIGACGFCKDEHDEHWIMQWIWLHPFARRSGQLSKAWPFFRQQYGEFRVKKPLSTSMRAFLDKIKYDHFA